MYVYIFEDGTIQCHETGPTDVDFSCIEDGVLAVLHSDSPIQQFGYLNMECDLEQCDLIQDDEDGEFHSPK